MYHITCKPVQVIFVCVLTPICAFSQCLYKDSILHFFLLSKEEQFRHPHYLNIADSFLYPTLFYFFLFQNTFFQSTFPISFSPSSIFNIFLPTLSLFHILKECKRNPSRHFEVYITSCDFYTIFPFQCSLC
jgi:hypothetical protein